MTYSISIAVILTTMLILGLVFLRTGNQIIKRILQGIAIVLAIAAYYCHYHAQATGEYHAISLVVAEYVVNAVQYFGRTGFGRIVMRLVDYAQKEEWVIYVLSAVVFALICFIPYRRKRSRR